MIVISCCIIIFITYLIIFGLLIYYFIKKRTIWNEIFSLNVIWNLILESIACPEHFILVIPGIIFENTICVEKQKKRDDAKIEIKKVLEYIRNIMKDIIDIPSSNSNSNSNNLHKIKWLIDGTMKDYDKMYYETSDFYYKLANSYDILNDKTNIKKSGTPETYGTLEDLVILEQNIELCENISNILNIFTNTDYKLLNQLESGYIVALLYDLIENIRIYKIKSLLYMM